LTEGYAMQRFKYAFLLPLSVFPAAIAVALFIGWTLQQVPKELAPAVALLLTLGVTAGGFLADRAAD
jgi:hypothetical protein